MTIVNVDFDYLFNRFVLKLNLRHLEFLMKVNLLILKSNVCSTGQYLDLRIGNIQIDNQLFGSSRPVLLRITRTDTKTKEEGPPMSPDTTGVQNGMNDGNKLEIVKCMVQFSSRKLITVISFYRSVGEFWHGVHFKFYNRHSNHRSKTTRASASTTSERGDLQQFDDHDQKAFHSTGGEAALEVVWIPWMG